MFNPFLTFASWTGFDNSCCGFVKKYRATKEFIINAWVAIWLECYFELIIGSMAGM